MSDEGHEMTGNANAYKYTISLQGYGGEYACIPLTEAQAAYWSAQGNAALAAHLALQGEEDEGVPDEYQLPDYREQGRNFVIGMNPENPVELMVEDEEGNLCFEWAGDGDISDEIFNYTQEVGPVGEVPDQPVAMYRTFLKGADIYEVTTNEPFDAARLKLECAEVARFGDVIFSISYEGGDVSGVECADRETDDPVAELLEK